MRISVETTSGLERKLTVGVPAKQVDSAVDVKLREVASSVRLPGFRPGKVPMRVMKQRFGAGVRQEVLGEVINRSFQEAVVSENLRPAGQPTIETRRMQAGEDVEYTATFEIFPHVEVKDIPEFSVERISADVTDDDVSEIIDVFRKQQGSLIEVSRSANTGDTLVIDYQGLKDGEVFDGGSATNASLELGSGRMIPGFEDGLIGAEKDEEVALNLRFPTDYHQADLSGEEVEFKVQVKQVQELEAAPINQALFSKYGLEDGSEEEFRAEVRKNMERELRNAVDTNVKNQVMDMIIGLHSDLELPNSLIDQEIQNMRQQMFQQFGQLKSEELDVESILPAEMFKERAERRIKLGLIVGEMITANEMVADTSKVRSTIEEIASTYQDPQEVINWYYSENEQLAGIESRVLEDEVVESVLKTAVVTEKICSYQDALSLARSDGG